MTECTKDKCAHQAFYGLRDSIAEKAALYAPDFLAAADPDSGRPFELWIDASEYAWACVLAQRETKGGCPRPLAMYGRSFSATEANWSAWERELYAYRESLAATDHLVKGFHVDCFTDHRKTF